MTIPGGMFVAPDFFCDDELKLEDAVALSAVMLSADSEQVVAAVVKTHDGMNQETRAHGPSFADESRHPDQKSIGPLISRHAWRTHNFSRL